MLQVNWRPSLRNLLRVICKKLSSLFIFLFGSLILLQPTYKFRKCVPAFIWRNWGKPKAFRIGILQPRIRNGPFRNWFRQATAKLTYILFQEPGTYAFISQKYSGYFEVAFRTEILPSPYFVICLRRPTNNIDQTKKSTSIKPGTVDPSLHKCTYPLTKNELPKTDQSRAHNKWRSEYIKNVINKRVIITWKVKKNFENVSPFFPYYNI